MNIRRIRSIEEYHEFRGFKRPDHPLLSVVDIGGSNELSPENIVLDFYSISLKRGLDGIFKYGQQNYNFKEGIMFFLAPNQVFSVGHNQEGTRAKPTGWMLLIHPDFFWNTPLARNIHSYGFFDYAVSEALVLLEKEETVVNNIVANIRNEYHSNIDKYSKQIIISQIESLLNYADRFYNRQFLTHEKENHHILERLEALLSAYFNESDLINKGLPKVQFVAQKLNISPDYLSGMLRALTGQNTQQHIHEKLIEKAKEKLTSTDLSVSEVAYQLGFEHLQSFSKLFKQKTGQSPIKFREGFN